MGPSPGGDGGEEVGDDVGVGDEGLGVLGGEGADAVEGPRELGGLGPLGVGEGREEVREADRCVAVRRI